ncbi:MAG: ATP-dependent helicase HrpA [Phenylobacterium sp.]
MDRSEKGAVLVGGHEKIAHLTKLCYDPQSFFIAVWSGILTVELLTTGQLFKQLDSCWGVQRGGFVRRINGAKKIKDEAKQQQSLAKIDADMQRSITKRQQRLDNRPDIEYPENLPVSQKKDQIAQAILENQVVIIAGETGSGKTTQIPKICMDLGLGVDRYIGHTQPRRLAARTVATRIAEELKSPLGEAVGFKIRFSDNVGDGSYIKLMTDGILLAEVINDRNLSQYDTIIIDEAHERSLNIDFLLGYFKQLLPKRPDLKLIITSATIDPQRFSSHFSDAPIIEVSGRTFPVEVRYRPINDDDGSNDRDQLQAIFDAVDELCRIGLGDILIFMNGEREIRDTADALEKRNLRDTTVLPLYARLSAEEQNRVFKTHRGRRIVLATNVAETSLTIPGIKYVIDPGTARISRYSFRTKVQRLPIEAISQASANQRKGRCGRVSEGICIRLFSEDDFINRPEFTDPEILRTNLASVILQMMALKLGDISDFPFVEAPDQRNINDGLRLLEEIGAVETASASKGKKASLDQSPRLSDIGRKISRLPVDPRLGRMVIQAAQDGCLHEVMVVTAALSIQDPRERPSDAKQKSDELHGRFADKQSDFITFINLWNHIKTQQRELSNSQFRKLCRKEFLAYMRVREWQDIYTQLAQVVKELSYTINQQEADYQTVHTALATGLLSHIGFKNENKEYLGARNSKFFLFPASGLYKKAPKWLMAAELVETSRLFGRVAAKIEPEWLEPISQHLINRSYSEAHWEKKRGCVMAYEKQTLYGLTLVPKRSVMYQKIAVDECRDIFIREALVNQQVQFKEPFLQNNLMLVEDIQVLENKSRRRDILVDEEDIFALYQQKVPKEICNVNDFTRWWRNKKKEDSSFLNFTTEDLMQHEAQNINANMFPDIWRQGELILPLEYHFEPAGDVDGVVIVVPLALLNQVDNEGFDWLIPGLHHELIVGLIRSLPKSTRRNFVPAPQYADAVLGSLEPGKSEFIEQVSKQLLRMTGVRVDSEDWNLDTLPKHLRFGFKVVDEADKVVAQGYDIDALKDKLQGKVKQTLVAVAEKGIEQKDITDWHFKDLPASYTQKRGQYEIKAYPALVAHHSSVAIELVDSEEEASIRSKVGLRKLILLNVPSPLSYVQKNLPNKAKLGLYYNPFGKIADLVDDCINCAVDHLLGSVELARNRDDYLVQRDRVRVKLNDQVVEVAIVVEQILGFAHKVNKRMKGKISLEFIQAFGDVKQQLSSLVFKGFVTDIGFDKLPDLIRYMKAIERRLEKMAIDPNRDRLNSLEIGKLDARLAKLNQGARLTLAQKQTLNDIRWMIEEFRVSVFAQNLGTPYPISAKRINNAFKEYESN